MKFSKFWSPDEQIRAQAITETGRRMLRDMIDAVTPDTLEIGDVVIAYQCDGCMAHDHKYLWVGTVTGFRDNRLTSASAIVKVHKRAECGDSRDHDLGEEFPVVADSSVQKIAPGLFFYYR